MCTGTDESFSVPACGVLTPSSCDSVDSAQLCAVWPINKLHWISPDNFKSRFITLLLSIYQHKMTHRYDALVINPLPCGVRRRPQLTVFTKSELACRLWCSIAQIRPEAVDPRLHIVQPQNQVWPLFRLWAHCHGHLSSSTAQASFFMTSLLFL